MNLYAYLDGLSLYDPGDALGRLAQEASRLLECYRVPVETEASVAIALRPARDKIRVALAGGDLLKAAFVSATCSWQIIEGLWAANGLPVPPNSSVRPHLGDLSGPADVHQLYERLFLGEAATRATTALALMDWTLDQLKIDRF